ncbi:uncharacterized protein DSM5745_02704 [Aspergillus mulundensis]|uniref:Uncharacterized protein n=1 Tax=Aspergillus mulundensis TaxID=1810919 RepID=A0A3D8SIF9_9EURO|nr:hypothetical protein DSM5745_02704 [Aspergillus mulundensis]RDW86062.1 hypothetical protein DSM5745_02704 [Aspergillus mulundensis]
MAFLSTLRSGGRSILNWLSFSNDKTPAQNEKNQPGKWAKGGWKELQDDADLNAESEITLKEPEEGWIKAAKQEGAEAKAEQLSIDDLVDLFKLKRFTGPIVDITDEELIDLPQEYYHEFDFAPDDSPVLELERAAILMYGMVHEAASVDEGMKPNDQCSYATESTLGIILKRRGEPVEVESQADIVCWRESAGRGTGRGLVVTGTEENTQGLDARVECVAHMATFLRTKKLKKAVMYGFALVDEEYVILMRLDAKGNLTEWRPAFAPTSTNRREFFAISRLFGRLVFGMARDEAPRVPGLGLAARIRGFFDWRRMVCM